jgi:hypothetical protein
VAAGEAEQGRQQRERHRHHHRHRQARHEAHHRDRLDAGDGQAADGDHHRDAGEQDGRPRRGDRPGRRLLHAEAEPQVLPVAGHHEQGVVDAHAEADHRGDRRRHRGDVDDGGRERDQPHARQEPDQGHADRQAHRHHRPEGDQQHHHRHAQADQLLAAQLGLAGGRRQLAAQLQGGGPGGADGLGGGLQRFEQLVEPPVAGHVVLHVGPADPPVVGQDEVADVAHVGLVGDVGQGAVDGDRGRSLVEPAPGCEHELGRRPGGPGEVLLQHVQRLLRLELGDGQIVVELTAGGLAEREHTGGEGDPGRDDEAPPPDREPAQPVEGSCHVAENLS